MELLTRLKEGHPAKKQEVKTLLELSDPKDIALLFATATKVREIYFQDRVFFYGFVYFSTFCRNDCRFCQYRQSNKALARYRKTTAQIVSAARELAEAGVHLIDLTMGEDSQILSSESFGEKGFLDMVKAVQQETGLPVMVSPGIVTDHILFHLADQGIEWYACYQETFNQSLYADLRSGQGFEKRLVKKQLAKDLGMFVEEGVMTGVGETLDDLTDAIICMRDSPADQVRVMTFVPQANTPMAGAMPQDSLRECLCIAVMRLLMPDRLIPASLDVDGLSGLGKRLEAGANVVTSIVPAQKGLSGVANQFLDIEESRRSLDHILPVIKAQGLKPALPEEYQAWIENRQ
ncbi:MAG: methylornithine synthase PylB [Desulfobacteraceae bacterium]|nr:methylornithine synthase PylB [Desulfobacteraceae bacterium]